MECSCCCFTFKNLINKKKIICCFRRWKDLDARNSVLKFWQRPWNHKVFKAHMALVGLLVCHFWTTLHCQIEEMWFKAHSFWFSRCLLLMDSVSILFCISFFFSTKFLFLIRKPIHFYLSMSSLTHCPVINDNIFFLYPWKWKNASRALVNICILPYASLNMSLYTEYQHSVQRLILLCDFHFVR